MQDLARAVKSIEEHHEELNVDPEDYAICGFLPGKSCRRLRGKEHGYAKYGVRKPERVDSGLSLDQREPLAGSSLLEHLEGTDRNLALRARTPLYVRPYASKKPEVPSACRTISRRITRLPI